LEIKRSETVYDLKPPGSAFAFLSFQREDGASSEASSSTSCAPSHVSQKKTSRISNAPAELDDSEEMDEVAEDVQNNRKSKKRVAVEDGVYEEAGNDKKGKMNASDGNGDGRFAGDWAERVRNRRERAVTCALEAEKMFHGIQCTCC
jgi:hypothetical protein